MKASESCSTSAVQPQNLPGLGVRNQADDPFLALHSHVGLVRADHSHPSARLFGEAAAGVLPRFLDVAPDAGVGQGLPGGERVAGGAQGHAERPQEGGPTAHPLALPASVDSPRVVPEGSSATLAEASVDGDGLHAEVFDGLFGASVFVEDSAAAARAGVGPAVRDGLDLGGDEAYSFHGRELLFGMVLLCPIVAGFPAPFFAHRL